MKPLTDDAGVVIHIGDTVRQSSAAVNPSLGALWVNVGQTGTVVGLGRTRARVDFGRTKRLVFGTVQGDEDDKVIDTVHTSMLTVVAKADGSTPKDFFSSRKLTQDELVAELRERYGEDPMRWAFTCPHCKTVTTGQRMRDALRAHPRQHLNGEQKITSDVLGRECIGRTDPDQGCDWAAYGLFKGPWEVEVEGGKTMYCFPIAMVTPA